MNSSWIQNRKGNMGGKGWLRMGKKGQNDTKCTNMS